MVVVVVDSVGGNSVASIAGIIQCFGWLSWLFFCRVLSSVRGTASLCCFVAGVWAIMLVYSCNTGFLVDFLPKFHSIFKCYLMLEE